MQKKQIEELFWKIFNAEDEEELHKLVTTDALLSDEKNWYPYGGIDKEDKTNFSTFESQQPKAIPAPIEKVTNSIDSLLLKECRVSGIDPKSAEAPNSMTEAVQLFFKIKNGDFSEVAEGSRREIAERLQIIAEGDTKRPNILIYDDGEGQRPEDFPKTFLSLRRRNKADLHFVQGKYNMGSTGAVIFCGRNRYQLIASKQDDRLAGNSLESDLGFTLVRRHPLSRAEKKGGYFITWYEYFIFQDRIPHFPITSIDLGLYKRQFKSGSCIKLYSYQLPRGATSDITLDLWRELNQFLYHPALPVLLYEKRFSGGKSPSKLMLGNKTRIVIDETEKKEKTLPISFSSADLGTVKMEATVFKQGVKQREFINQKAVIFSLNGQVHGFLPRRFISQNLNFSMLRDSLLINVDCTKMDGEARMELFMANRYNMKEGEDYEKFIDKIVEELKSNDELIRLNQERKKQIMREKSGDKEFLTKIFNTFPLDNKMLDMLRKGGKLRFPKRESNTNDKRNQKPQPKKEEKKFSGKRFPSVFDLKLPKSNGRMIKTIPLNGRGILEFETDVDDDYFFRPKDRGDLIIEILKFGRNGISGNKANRSPSKVTEAFEVSVSGPTNGLIKVVFNPRESLSVGDELELDAKLTSPSGDIQAIFYIRIVDPKKQTKQKSRKKKKKDFPDLPKPIPVYELKREEADVIWSEMGWSSGDDIVKVVMSDKEEGKIDAIAVNMDSYALTRYISRKRINGKANISFVRDKYFADVYMHTLILFSIFTNFEDLDSTQPNWDKEGLIANLFNPYGEFLLYTGIEEQQLKFWSDEQDD